MPEDTPGASEINDREFSSLLDDSAANAAGLPYTQAPHATGAVLAEERRTYAKPSSVRSSLFQLAESNDLQRVSFLLDSLASCSQDNL